MHVRIDFMGSGYGRLDRLNVSGRPFERWRAAAHPGKETYEGENPKSLLAVPERMFSMAAPPNLISRMEATSRVTS